MTSRRDFLVRAGQAAAAISLSSPALSRILDSAAYAESNGLVRSTVPLDVTPITSGMRWRTLGPFRGGRTASATGVPGRPNEFYFGAVNGGVWKSIDGGRTWLPIFDSQPVASIGAIAVAPSAPDTIYVGSGESTLRDSNGYGNGVYKSTDAGRTWTHIGLSDTQHIGKIAVDPRDPNVLYVAAIGHLYGPNSERGVYKSTDGGRTWRHVLNKGADVGAVEVVIDPINSQTVYAGLWNTRRPPWFTYAPTNGPGGGIYKSTDGGANWVELKNGLPPEGIGRTGIAVAPSNPQRIYAVVDCLVPDPSAPAPTPAAPLRPGVAAPGQGGVFRSDNGGSSWTKLSGDTALWGRGWYFEKVTVDPRNADIVYVPNVAVNRSKDGGRTWVPLRGSPGGDDYHQAWISPDDPNTMIVASDQGAVVTRNAAADDPRTVTWSSWLNQATAQLYHISVDYRRPYWVTGAQQDSGAVAVRSRGKFGEISTRDWEPIAPGGESGYTAGDRLNPGIVFGGTGQRFDLETNTAVRSTTSPTKQAEDRADWTQPLVISGADPRAMYYGSQFVYKTTDAAKTWRKISPDLTRPEVVIPATLDAAAANQVDRNGKNGVVYAIAPSPLRAPLLWIGTDDGLIQLSPDDGASWQNVTPAAITPWSRITSVEASHFDAATAYASVDRHQLQDYEPYVYRTRDMGKSWQKITAGLPQGVYVHVIKEDPMRRGLLVAGTERGAFISMDDGDNWQPLQLNLPVTSVRDFQFHEADLVVGTHGRGIWVIDDISPLRQLTEDVLLSAAHLFKPATAVNWEQSSDNGTPLQKDEPQAENPPVGAVVDFYLRSPSSVPVTLEILGEGTAGHGLHRVHWNPVTPTTGAQGIDGGPRSGGEPLAGTFTARLSANGQYYAQTFTVLPDPRVR